MSVVQIVVAEDDALIRHLILAFIGMRPELAVVGEAGSGADGIRLTASLQPDWLITDYDLGDMLADEMVAAARELAPLTRILLHSGRAEIRELAQRLDVDRWAPKTAKLLPLEQALQSLCQPDARGCPPAAGPADAVE